ncbi:hypothetical protein AB4Y38_42155 [Paraburkholderia sp. EG285A]|uniref:hypothetical protein n=1 Tax=Paraburkholderia sp. EG285A TaxID=3237009 RepID=UPI0034D19190
MAGVSDEVVATVAPKIDAFKAKLPGGYRVETGGLFEESAISRTSVFAVVPVMIVLMFTSMMVLLVCFRRLAMEVAVMPLGLIGVVLSAAGVQPAARYRRDSGHSGVDRHEGADRRMPMPASPHRSRGSPWCWPR